MSRKAMQAYIETGLERAEIVAVRSNKKGTAYVLRVLPFNCDEYKILGMESDLTKPFESVRIETLCHLLKKNGGQEVNVKMNF